MSSLEEQIRELEDELRNTPYNKATSKHIGRLKAKLAKIRDEAVTRAMASSSGGEGYSVKKVGGRHRCPGWFSIRREEYAAQQAHRY